ncbi:MAG: hypothetical protein A3K10_16845 [Bacteroidetes bacterium RIFCSPLOWO2_12_FULL_31_6]|nr:MAG: hypothetical protein A3K10_16845 [Bacteroidetes bacterium RIFCSPLOWO2_12_FULL_31_6]
MRKTTKILSLVVMLTFSFELLTFNCSAQDTLTVLSYNILNYPTSNPTKADTLKPIIKYLQPDIFMITELNSSAGATTLLNNALNVDGVTYYQKATYYNGPDTDNMLYYNANKLTLYSQHEIPTTLRNISEYVLYYNGSALTAASDTVFIYCYMAHLKASQGYEQQRNQEVVLLKNYMDTRTNIENVFLGGDFNLYTSTEPAFNTILNGGNVLLLDPISSPGNWNSNSSFAGIHTQSTRLSSLPDGGSYGGMDDRFDFLFFTNDLLTGANKLTYVANSYKAVGNDGNHYNKSINATPTNSSAPANVIDALYYMSDHLPITLKAYLPANVSVNENSAIIDWKGYVSNGIFVFKATEIEKELTLNVYNLLGEIITTSVIHNQREFNMDMKNLQQGIYFINVISDSKQECFKVVSFQ